MSREYNLPGELLGEITCGRQATGGMSLLEYDDILFGGVGEVQAGAPPARTLRERRAALLAAKQSVDTQPKPKYDMDSDGVYQLRRDSSGAIEYQARPGADQATDSHAGEYSNPLNARFKDAGGTPFGNDPLSTGFSPGLAQERENAILASPVKTTGNDLTNM